MVTVFAAGRGEEGAGEGGFDGGVGTGGGGAGAVDPMLRVG